MESLLRVWTNIFKFSTLIISKIHTPEETKEIRTYLEHYFLDQLIETQKQDLQQKIAITK